MSKDDWNTPPEIVDLLGVLWPQGIGLDPCSNQTSLVGAAADLGPGEDGLVTSWDVDTWNLDRDDTRTVFVNPPFSNVEPWLARACTYPHLEIVCLVPASTNSAYWGRWVWPHAARICFTSPRVAFVVPETGKPKKGAREDHALLYYGDKPERFAAVFSRRGAICRPPGVAA